MNQFSRDAIWKALEKASTQLGSYFMDSSRKPFSLPEVAGIKLDISNQRVNPAILDLLSNLAETADLKGRIQALFAGEAVNVSMKLPALHTALRSSARNLWVNGEDILKEIAATREKIFDYARQIRSGQWRGFSGKKITDIVNIGIGGSDLGPRFCINALTDFQSADFRYHFISDADPHSFDKVISTLEAESTLFIVSSKSFTTRETLYNARKAMNWLNKPAEMDKHFIAVTANDAKAKSSGFNHILKIWDWVGGRYSTCSAINFITAIAIGEEAFVAFLEGAEEMDDHFKSAPWLENMPVLLALTGIWNINFLKINNLLILNYSSFLNQFVEYIQQLDMESNGKSLDLDGREVRYSTGPIVWGGNGNQAQHSYFQHLCQGRQKVAVDFISVDSMENHLINRICLDKKETLTRGIFDETNIVGFIPGKTPLNHLRMTACDPKTIGALIALYEHKIYTQSVLWRINPFDQPGVDAAKKAASIPLLPEDSGFTT